MCRSPKRQPTAEDDVGIEEDSVARAGRRLDPDLAGVKRVAGREGAFGHRGVHHRNLEVLGELSKLAGGAGQDRSAANQEDRLFGGEEHLDRSAHPADIRPGSVDRQRAVDRRIVVDFAALDVERQVDQNRAGAPLLADPKGVAKDPGNLGRLRGRSTLF